MRSRASRRILPLVFLAAAAGLAFAAASSGRAAEPTSPGLDLPKPGTYILDHIQRAPNGVVLEGDWRPRWLSTYTKGAITLFSFFYASCPDPAGCSRVWAMFEEVRKAITQRPDLQGRVRFVFVSLDPTRDTPAMMQMFARDYAADAARAPWHFLTTYSNFFLTPMLRNMGEEISIDRQVSAKDAPVLNHMLKVFLIDREGWVREIYSDASLDAAAIVGDITSLAMESGPAN